MQDTPTASEKAFRLEALSGPILLAAAVVALVAANSPWAGNYSAFWQVAIGVHLGGWSFHKSIVLWINDGLMVLFFFRIGLEIKRELLFGELNDRAKATLPVVAAMGGMVAPAVVYLLFLCGRPGSHGWGIPTATDIAFSIGFLALLGSRVPQ